MGRVRVDMLKGQLTLEDHGGRIIAGVYFLIAYVHRYSVLLEGAFRDPIHARLVSEGCRSSMSRPEV